MAKLTEYEDSIINQKGVKIIKDFIPIKNKTSRPQLSMTPEYITIHNTGNNRKGANAKMHTEYVDNTERYVSWHFTVDDENIIQELPYDEVSWHAGDGRHGTGNRKSLSIEICENKDIDYSKAEENTIELIIYLMNKHDIPIGKVVPHQHWKSKKYPNGKYCPHKILDYGWNKFAARIQEKLDDELDYKGSYEEVQKSLTEALNKLEQIKKIIGEE